jgi:uncharacterized protein YozE (UPF0346 family)
MTLIESIKSKLSEDDELGDLARDIQGDKEFPANRSDKEIISYLQFKTGFKETDSTLKRLTQEYKNQREKLSSNLDLDASFALLRSENWRFYKKFFPVHKVILIGTQTDIYKAYCIDSTNQKALYFDIKSSKSLNDLEIIDEEKIHKGNLTQTVSVPKAIKLLENCAYPENANPNEETIKELVEFLELND